MIELALSVFAGRLDLTRLGAALTALEEAGVDEVVIETGDAASLEEDALALALVRQARGRHGLKWAALLAGPAPDRGVAACVAAGCSSVILPLEDCPHVHRALSAAQELGAIPGLSVRPGTPLTALEYVLPVAGRVLLPSAERGGNAAAGAPALFERVRILSEHARHQGHRVEIVAAGGMTAEAAGRASALGAARVVMDETGLGAPDVEALGERVRAFRIAAKAARRMA